MVGVVAEEVLEAGRVARDVVEPVGEARSQRTWHVFDGSAAPGSKTTLRANRHTIVTLPCQARVGYVPRTFQARAGQVPGTCLAPSVRQRSGSGSGEPGSRLDAPVSIRTKLATIGIAAKTGSAHTGQST